MFSKKKDSHSQGIDKLKKILKSLFWHHILRRKISKDIKESLNQIGDAIENNEDINHKVSKLENICSSILKSFKPISILESTLSTIFTILLVIFIRSSFYENYKVPTGSMRPTIKEQDHLIVSKTSFGINNPITQKPFFVDKSRIKHGQIIAFTSEGLDILDPFSYFLGIIKMHKRFVKRLIAKEGDYVFFDSGKAVVMNDKNEDVSLEKVCPELKGIEHCPTIRFGGKLTWKDESKYEVIASFFNIPWIEMDFKDRKIGNIKVIGQNNDMFPFGIQRHGFANLIEKRINNTKVVELHIFHSPTIHESKHTEKDSDSPFLVQKSILYLLPHQIDRIKNSLCTSRFVVKSELASRYGSEEIDPIIMKNIPDGIYEFENGVAFKIDMFGNASELEKTHPLYNNNMLKKLFSHGIEWQQSHNIFSEDIPLRHVYFRDGDLILMNSVIASRDEPNLKDFIEKELKRSQNMLYTPFVPNNDGPYDKDGNIRPDFMKQNGLKIPKNKLLMLGDNHAGSGDSREFGFVDIGKIHGTVQLMLWPISSLLKQFGPTLISFTPNIYSIPMWIMVVVVLCMPYIKKRFWKYIATKKRPWNNLD